MSSRTLMLRTALGAGMLMSATLVLHDAAQAQSATSAPADVVTNFGSQRVLLDAARMKENDALAQAPTDPRRARSLYEAAHLFAYAGRTGHARKLLVMTADAALHRGDVIYAADALVKAAVLAQEDNNGAAGMNLVARVEALATSPLLRPSERFAILSRIDRGAVVVGRK